MVQNITFEKIHNTKYGHLYFLISMPRAGKSTFARKWLELRQAGDNPRVIVNQDTLRVAFHGEVYKKEAEPAIFVFADYMAKSLLLNGFDVLMDETSSSIETLKRYYRLDRDAVPIWMDTPKEICIQRALDLGQNYLLPVIERIHFQIEWLKPRFHEVRKEILLSI